MLPDSVPGQGLEKSGTNSIVHKLKTGSQSCFVTERVPVLTFVWRAHNRRPSKGFPGGLGILCEASRAG